VLGASPEAPRTASHPEEIPAGFRNQIQSRLLDPLPLAQRLRRAAPNLEHLIAGVMRAGMVLGVGRRAESLPRKRLSQSAPLAELPTGPITGSEALEWFRRKLDLPTVLGSLEISASLDTAMRNQAFFCARVAETNILASLRQEIERILAGELNFADARLLLQEFLQNEGYAIPAPGTPPDRSLTQLGSYRRLELILWQNTAMAQAVGQRMVSEHPAVQEGWPSYRYVANTERHAQFDGIVLPKTDPFWQNHYPPWDFNCRCMVLDDEGPANARSSGWYDAGGGAVAGTLERGGNLVQADMPPSGFAFDSRPDHAWETFRWDSIENPGLRASARRAFDARTGQ